MAYSTISKHTTHFNTTLYSGTGSNATVTGVGFQPDFFWIKQRTGNQGHLLWDAIRGGNYYVPSSSTAQSNADIGTFTVASDGYSYGSDAAYNGSGHTYVGYNWKAGGTAPTKTYHVVVVSDSGNKYRFRNTADSATFGSSAVTLDLQEGGTYTFDVSDSTLNSHPFVIGTAANGTEYSTGVTYKLDGVTKTYSQYTSGFSAATSRQLIITVAASAPALYYWCSAHSGMGGAINTNATFGSSNFDGNLQSLVSTNTTAGFSVVGYTGNGSASATVGHGLGGTIDQIWQKDLTATDSWHIYTTGMSSGYNLYFNNSGQAQNPSDGSVNNFTSTTYGFNANGGNVNAVNENAIPCITYCFKSIPGYSSYGVYNGNGQNDGAFVYTGFAPKWLMCKKYGGGGSWGIVDIKRDSNGQYGHDNHIAADTADAETTSSTLNAALFSNGFKLMSNNSDFNASGSLYLYAAIGETEVGTNNIPATAF